MIFAVILAGGNGARMGLTDVPKQFLAINNKPILITTVEKFVINNKLKKVIVLSPANWIEHTSDLIKKYILDKYGLNVKVLYGGSVNDGNIKTLEEIPNVDGYLIGGSSLKVDSMKNIVNCVVGE